MKEQEQIRAYVNENDTCCSKQSKHKNDTLVINIDSCLDYDINIVEFRVDGKVHRFTTKQVSLFLSYVTEGLFE